MVEAIGLNRAERLAPAVGVGRRIAGEREDAAVERAAQEHRPAVQVEALVAGGEAADTEAGGDAILQHAVPPPCHLEPMQHGIELVPERGALGKVQLDVEGGIGAADR